MGGHTSNEAQNANILTEGQGGGGGGGEGGGAHIRDQGGRITCIRRKSLLQRSHSKLAMKTKQANSMQQSHTATHTHIINTLQALSTGSPFNSLKSSL